MQHDFGTYENCEIKQEYEPYAAYVVTNAFDKTFKMPQNCINTDFLRIFAIWQQAGEMLRSRFMVPVTMYIDGYGAVLMHMGAMAVIGSNRPNNLIHVVINNGAHETVGGMPTVASGIDLVAIAKVCGYPKAVSVDNFSDLDKELNDAKEAKDLTLIEVKCSIGARDDLGRPTTTALENKQNFMKYVSELK